MSTTRRGPEPRRHGECENCGHRSEDLAAVRRMYVVPESWDQAGSETTLEDVEQWCWSCRTQYPHQEVQD